MIWLWQLRQHPKLIGEESECPSAAPAAFKAELQLEGRGLLHMAQSLIVGSDAAGCEPLKPSLDPSPAAFLP